MEIDDLLAVMDRAGANLAKLQQIWDRAAPFIPTGPSRGSHPEYDELARSWNNLLSGLPPIDGWTITEPLPDLDGLGQSFIDYLDIGEPPFAALEAGEQPGKDLDEYRSKLNRARRRAARDRLEHLSTTIDETLPQLLASAPADPQAVLSSPAVDRVRAAIAEVERLMGDTAERRGRWNDLHRHMRFGEVHDWNDIAEYDWPSVRPDIEAAAFTESDPLPVPADLDLGVAAAGRLTGSATLALAWERLSDDEFERLLYDLLAAFPDHQNVQWLTHTRAPDRGRDLSMERVLHTATGTVRTERVLVQAKHWLTKSVGPAHMEATVAGVKLWQPPVVRGLIVATSGRFSADAVAYTEQHNNTGAAPEIELWPSSKLETLLSQKPHLAAAHGLR